MTMSLSEQFLAFDCVFTQDQMQAYLSSIYQQSGLNKALDKLYQWAFGVGYLTESKLNDNKRYRFADPETGVCFRTQINIARSSYTPKPIKGKNIPKLHCPICYENVGIPGKEDLRVFGFDLSPGRPFFVQLTPFPLFPKHFVLVDRQPRPMIMEKQSVQDLVDFIQLASGYTGCSNSDVEWAGASILVHHHYQVFDDLQLPIMEAQVIEAFSGRMGQASLGLLHYPIATCRLVSPDASEFIDLAGRIIAIWKQQDPGHNTCNLVIRKLVTGCYEAHIIFRNPAYLTPPSLTKIKSEGVGIIEVAGEGIYPVPDTQALWQEIERDGLAVIKGIIAGNNPVKRAHFGDLFALLLTA